MKVRERERERESMEARKIQKGKDILVKKDANKAKQKYPPL